VLLHSPLLVECCNRFLMAPRSDVHPASSAGFFIVAQGRTVLSGHPGALLPGSTRVFWLLFILWEVYWGLEIHEQYVGRAGRLALPYGFLFFMTVVLPLTLYLFLRRRLRRVAIIPVDQQR
jgi:hypothetical protein